MFRKKFDVILLSSVGLYLFVISIYILYMIFNIIEIHNITDITSFNFTKLSLQYLDTTLYKFIFSLIGLILVFYRIKLIGFSFILIPALINAYIYFKLIKSGLLINLEGLELILYIIYGSVVIITSLLLIIKIFLIVFGNIPKKLIEEK